MKGVLEKRTDYLHIKKTEQDKKGRKSRIPTRPQYVVLILFDASGCRNECGDASLTSRLSPNVLCTYSKRSAWPWLEVRLICPLKVAGNSGR